MGVYLNPSHTTNEKWLETHGKAVRGNPLCAVIRDYDDIRTRKKVPICLMDNGAFKVAAILYSKDEARVCARVDRRPKRWFIVPVTALRDDSGISVRLLDTIEAA